MVDWVHCNICFQQPFEVKAQFHLTNCGHIYCENCLKQAPGFCQMCKQKSSCILLTNKMKPEVEKFFTAPKETIKQLLQVIDFQDGHRQRLLQQRKNGQFSQKGTDNEKMAAAFRELQKELQKFKEENNQLRRAIHMMRSQHPDDGKGSRSATPYQSSLSQPVRQSPLTRPPGPQANFDPRLTPNGRQQQLSAGNTPASSVQYHQKMRASTERLSVRTPPIGGLIGTPSPCKTYKPSGSGGYSSSQQRGRSIQGSQSSPAGSQIRSRSVTPIQSLSRPYTPNRSPAIHASQRQFPTDSIPQKPANRTPYTPRSDYNSSPMKLNSSLDPAQRQIRLSYQPRTAMLSQSSAKSSTTPL